jgi:hypothetical protein
MEVKHLYELLDVLCVTGSRGECLHREEMFWRSSEDPKARMVEHAGLRRIPTRRDVGTCLLVQPPGGQAQFGAYCLRFFKHDAVWLKECVDVPGGAA